MTCREEVKREGQAEKEIDSHLQAFSDAHNQQDNLRMQ
jgi:hypothetical protein